MRTRSHETVASTNRLIILSLVVGVAISSVMVLRSQVDGDQGNLLARGWILAEHGIVVPWGNLTSAGGYEPGSLTSLVVGIPMLVWSDHRAPAFLILLFHILA